MKENSFYLIDNSYIKLINNLGGKYGDSKQRPIYCCIKDKNINGLFWAIPTSDISHRTQNQIAKYNNYIQLPKMIFVLRIIILVTPINRHYIELVTAFLSQINILLKHTFRKAIPFA